MELALRSRSVVSLLAAVFLLQLLLLVTSSSASRAAASPTTTLSLSDDDDDNAVNAAAAAATQGSSWQRRPTARRLLQPSRAMAVATNTLDVKGARQATATATPANAKKAKVEFNASMRPVSRSKSNPKQN